MAEGIGIARLDALGQAEKHALGVFKFVGDTALVAGANECAPTAR